MDFMLPQRDSILFWEVETQAMACFTRKRSLNCHCLFMSQRMKVGVGVNCVCVTEELVSSVYAKVQY